MVVVVVVVVEVKMRSSQMARAVKPTKKELAELQYFTFSRCYLSTFPRFLLWSYRGSKHSPFIT